MHPRFEEVDIEDLCAELNSKVKIVGVPALEFTPLFWLFFICCCIFLYFLYPFTSFPLSFFHFIPLILLSLYFPYPSFTSFSYFFSLSRYPLIHLILEYFLVLSPYHAPIAFRLKILVSRLLLTLVCRERWPKR